MNSTNTLTTDEMKEFVRQHFEEFVNRRNSGVIHRNMTPGFLDHDSPGGKTADAVVDEKMMEAMEFHGFVLWRFENDGSPNVGHGDHTD